MQIRAYREQDFAALLRLFWNTVHTVNRKDYTPAQLDAWAPAEPDERRWRDTLATHDTVVAEENGIIIGFGDMDDAGHFDRLYVHADFQGQGVATLIADTLEGRAAKQGIRRFTTEASITARPFFEGRGYRVLRQQKVYRQGQSLTNFRMEKKLEKN